MCRCAAMPGSTSASYPLSHLALLDASSPKGTPFGAAAKFPATAKAVPLGKVAATNGSGLRGFFSVTLPYKMTKRPLENGNIG